MQDLGPALQLKDVGFILEKTLSKVLLKEISGTLPQINSPSLDWWPFKKTSLTIDSLRVVLKRVDDPATRGVGHFTIAEINKVLKYCFR